MARRSTKALAGAAGACLMLAGCGGGGTPTAAGTTTASGTTAASPAAGGFCGDATTFMQHIPAAPRTKNLTSAQAKANMVVVLAATVHGFAALEKHAPGSLRTSLRKIVRVYTSDEKIMRATGDLATASEAMAREDTAGSESFQVLLKYISRNCH
jgi:hypothetical protein